MPNSWENLTESERALLTVLHESGASPRGSPQKALKILMKALNLIGQWTQEIESAARFEYSEAWPPLLRELDDALLDLARQPRAGSHLVEGHGNYGNPQASLPACHPAFRDCRISLAGQKLVLKAKGIAPKALQDDILGTLEWNPSESWWEGTMAFGFRNPIKLSLYQIIPGTALDLGPARRTLTSIKDRETRLRHVVAAGALHAGAWLFDELGQSSKEELHHQLLLYMISLDAKGGAEITYHADCLKGHDIIADVNVKGFCENVMVYS